MNALEKAKVALREHLKANKDKVLADLEQMKSKSSGMDIYSYLDGFNNHYSFKSYYSPKEFTYSDETLSFEQEMAFYDILNSVGATFSPPDSKQTLKSSNPEESLQGFFISL